MNSEEIAQYLSDMSDEELIAKTKEAQKDLTEAAEDSPDSEWHEACFAGLFIYAGEMRARGLKLVPIH